MKKFYELLCTTRAALTVLLMGIFLLAANAVQAQSVTTDKLDYAPDETVYITGTHFKPYENVLLTIVHIDPNMPDVEHPHVSVTVTADSAGYFEAEWYVDIVELNTTLLLMAEGDLGSYAETVFTDASGVTQLIVTAPLCAQGGSFNIKYTPKTGTNITVTRDYT